MSATQVTTNELKQSLDLLTELVKASATKDDIFEIKWELRKFVTREELILFKDEILTAVDSIGVKHRTFDEELVMLRGQYLRHEDRIEAIEEHIHHKST